MTALPAGEQRTGTVNLTGEGNEAKGSGISDETVEAAYQAHLSKTLTTYHQWHGNPRDAMRAALEAAAPAIRQQVAEEIAAKLDERHRGNLALSGGDLDIIPRDGRVGLATGYQRAAQIAREIGGQR